MADITDGLTMFQRSVQAFYGLPDSIAGQAESAPVSSFMEPERLESLAGEITAFAETVQQKESLSGLADEIRQGSITTQQLLERLFSIMRGNPRMQGLAGRLAASGDMELLLKQMVDETLKLTPADVAREDGIKNYYKRVRETIEKAEEAAGKQGGVDQLSKSMESIKSNIDFMNDLNRNMTYFQMPIHFSQSDANGELYVFTNKKALASGADNVSAMLHLDMENLGAVDVYVRLAGKSVSTDFCLESEEMLDFVYANIGKLNARLEALGYSVNFEMKVAKTEEPFDFVQDFIDREQAVLPTSQYIFDIKA